MNNIKTIAILGATGYIGKSLSYCLSQNKYFDVFLFARSKNKLNILKNNAVENKLKILSPLKIKKHKFDIIINCIGIGGPNEIKKAGYRILETTEKFDNLIINYLKKNPRTFYINLSSGAVYGKNINKPINKKTLSIIDVNSLDYNTLYSIAKINSEAKHRSLKNLNIVDLRIFSFFSRFIRLDAGYLISDILKSIKYNEVLITSQKNIIRDFVHPNDLLNLIKLITKMSEINDYFDVYSKNPVSKFELLEYFKNKYGLKYKVVKNIQSNRLIASRDIYFTNNKKAKKIGYSPKYTSLEGINSELKNILW